MPLWAASDLDSREHPHARQAWRRVAVTLLPQLAVHPCSCSCLRNPTDANVRQDLSVRKSVPGTGRVVRPYAINACCSCVRLPLSPLWLPAQLQATGVECAGPVHIVQPECHAHVMLRRLNLHSLACHAGCALRLGILPRELMFNSRCAVQSGECWGVFYSRPTLGCMFHSTIRP